MTVWWGLLRKELLEISRDKRALMSALGLAFLAPIVIYGALSFAIKQASDTPPVWVTVTNPDAAPVLIELLAEAKIYDTTTSADPNKPENGRLDITFEEDFVTAVSEGRQTEVILRGELKDDAVRPTLNRVRGVIRRFSSTTASVRLMMRGVDPRLVRPVDIQEQDTAPASNNAGPMTMMIGIYVMMAAFVMSTSSAIDTSAGERERNVLEALLIQPVRSIDIVTAKLAGVVAVAMFGVTLTLTFSAIAMSQVALEKVGMSFTLSPTNFTAVLLTMVPVALLGGATNLFVAYFSKTFKEAQSQVTMVIMIPAIAPMALMFTPDPPEILRQLPVTGQFLFLEQLFKAESVDPLSPILAGGMTLVLVVALLWFTARQLGSERSINAL